MSTLDALVIGEALTDIVRAADGEVSSRPGGSPANVAVGLARLGVRTELLTCLGPDARGDELREHLVGAGVGLRATTEGATAATSSAQAVLDATGAAEYSFDLTWQPGGFAPGPVRLIHTGSLATVVDPGAGEVLSALAAAEPGTVVSIDPNARPQLGLCQEHVRAQCELFARRAHLVKLSDEDLAWMYPGQSVEAVMARLHRLGVHLVVVTRGAKGCTLATPHWHSELAAPQVSVVDTIGAGDSFMSGLLCALLASQGEAELRAGTVTQQQAEEWARTALRCAAITVGRAGAQPPLAEELTIAAQSDTISSVPA